MKSVGIIGFGRFGKILANILKKGYAVRVFDSQISSHSTSASELNAEFGPVEIVDLESVLKETVIFIAVPIRAFESVIKSIAPQLQSHQTIIDVCSVKTHPITVMKEYLPPKVGIIATHPLFGPDSYLSNEAIKIVMHLERAAEHNTEGNRLFLGWKDFFTKQGITVVEMTPEEHDRMAAETQGLTHYLGRFLKEYGIKKTSIDTQGFTTLLQLVEQTCNDTWELFIDLQNFNPYTQEMIDKMNKSIHILNEKTELNSKENQIENKTQVTT